MKTLIFVEHDEGKIKDVVYELISKAYSLDKHSEISVVSIGTKGGEIKKQLEMFPVKNIYNYNIEKKYDVNLYGDICYNLCKEIKNDVLMIGGTGFGRAVAPVIAGKLKTGLTADCTELELDEAGDLIQIRPAFEETLLAYIKTSTTPKVMTIRPGVMEIVKNTNKYEANMLEKNIDDLNEKYKILGIETKEKTNNINIKKEKILVVLGNGIAINKIEYFKEYAKKIGGEIASSRKLVEKGIFNIERQIGLSGNSVSADLIITLGVSGSVQFQAGIKNVKKIIAINIDENAPIFQVADICIKADVNSLLF